MTPLLLTPQPLIRRRELQRLLGVSSETVRRWLATGVLPPPDVQVSDQASWWRPDTLAAAGFKLLPSEPAQEPATADPAEANQPTPAAS